VGGDLTLQLEDGRTATGHYALRWGHFVSGNHLASRGLWTRLTSTTLVGTITVPSRPAATYEFEAESGPWVTEKTWDDDAQTLLLIRSLKADVSCRNSRSHRVTVRLTERVKEAWVPSQTDMGWDTTPALERVYLPAGRTLMLELYRLDASGRHTVLGTAYQSQG
jgi:hypothetical protein